jgi:hypothetical protein
VYFSSALLLQLGPEIPGVPLKYIPTQGAQQVLHLYSHVQNASWWLLGGLMVVGGGLVVFGLLAKMNITPYEVAMRGILAACLLAAYPLIFKLVLVSGAAVAEIIMSDEDYDALNEAFRRAADAELAERDAQAPFYEKWIRQISSVVSSMSLGGAILTELIMGLGTILFFVSAIVINLLWRLFVVLMFVSGPLLIVLGSIPVFGPRVLGSWITGIIQISAWQVYMALMAFMVKTADGFFQRYVDLAHGKVDTVNHFESIAITFAFGFLYLATPFMVNAVLPFSKVSMMATHGFLAATNSVIGFSSSLTRLPQSFARLK